MVPTTSDGYDDRERSPSDDAYGFDRRTIQGRETLVSRHPGRITVEWRGPTPRFFGLAVGDRLKDADSDVASPRIAEWTVTGITPDLVVGEATRTGERREFDRRRVERGLVVGNYATALSGFERVVVHAVGRWADYDEADDATDATDADDAGGASAVYRGRPYVTVVASGDNGRTYGLRYRYAEAGRPDAVTLWQADAAVADLDPELREQLTAAVGSALAAEGYAVA
jgi:hypothetical protein